MLQIRAWAEDGSYVARELLIDDGTLYFAAEDHDAGASFAADLAAGKWRAIAGAPVDPEEPGEPEPEAPVPFHLTASMHGSGSGGVIAIGDECLITVPVDCSLNGVTDQPWLHAMVRPQGTNGFKVSVSRVDGADGTITALTDIDVGIGGSLAWLSIIVGGPNDHIALVAGDGLLFVVTELNGPSTTCKLMAVTVTLNP